MAQTRPMPTLSMYPLHTRPELLESCAELLQSIWPTCKSDRLRRLVETETCTDLPSSLVLVEHEEHGQAVRVIGHARLVTVTNPARPKSAFVEAVCIARSKQGLGHGKELMGLVERHAAEHLECKLLFLICLQGMARFYERLSYETYPVLTLETTGANLLVTFDKLSWYGNRPSIGWESAYDDGPIVSEDEMKRQVHGQVTMVKTLTNHV